MIRKQIELGPGLTKQWDFEYHEDSRFWFSWGLGMQESKMGYAQTFEKALEQAEEFARTHSGKN